MYNNCHRSKNRHFVIITAGSVNRKSSHSSLPSKNTSNIKKKKLIIIQALMTLGTTRVIIFILITEWKWRVFKFINHQTNTFISITVFGCLVYRRKHNCNYYVLDLYASIDRHRIFDSPVVKNHWVKLSNSCLKQKCTLVCDFSTSAHY